MINCRIINKASLVVKLSAAPLIFSSALWPCVGSAQQAIASGTGATASAALEEIVVTAQKRQQSIQDVPIAVTAISPEALAANRIVTTQDLQFLAPSLLYTQLGGYALPYIRGIGSDISSPDQDTSVATYIDGAYVADSQSMIDGLLGVERVEVLEGPQGTLFGRNSLAGAISVTTLTPKQQLEAAASVTRGNYDDIEATARASGGVTDNLAVGIYAATVDRASYFNRTFVEGEPHRDKQSGVRLKAVYDVTSRFTLTGSVTYTVTQSPDTSAFRQGQIDSYGFKLFGAPTIVEPWVIQSDYPAKNENHGFNATLREDLDLGPVDIVGISNYRNNRIFTSNDLDATSAGIIGSYAYQFARQYSQELQVLSQKGSAFEYIGGLYYFHQDSGEVPTVTSSPVLFLPATNSFTIGAVATNSYAAYTQLTYKPVDNLRLTAGGRYTSEKKALYNSASGISDAPGLIIDPSVDLLSPITRYANQAKSWSQFTPKLGVDYRIDDTLLYATYSEGFQSGAYNLVNPAQAPINPELLRAYELGSKSDFFDNRMRLNLSAYYYNFTNIQVSDFIGGGSGNGGAETIYLNAAKAKAWGFESSLEFAITHELRVNAQAAYEHSRYSQFDSYPAMFPAAVGFATVPTNVTGNQMEHAPRWVGSLSMDYDTQIAQAGELKASLGAYINGGFYWDPSNLYRQSSYALLNGSAGYTFPNSRWTVTGWAKNITNKNYAAINYPIAFGDLTLDGPPRTLGVTASFQY